MDEIDRIRAFNRYYTRKIGVLNRTFFDSGLTLSELRLLHEVDVGGGLATARALSRDLDLDEGRASGYARMTLLTQSSQLEARKLYAAEGFRLVSSRPAQSFGKTVVEEDWTIEFAAETALAPCPAAE